MKSLRINIKIPKWAAILYIAGSLIILPWAVYLDQTLPAHHVVRHWDVAWVGLDTGLLLSLLLTGLLAYKKSIMMVLAATATGSFLLVDTWFDILSARPGTQLSESVALAIFIEVPLALVSYGLAYRVIRKIYYR